MAADRDDLAPPTAPAGMVVHSPAPAGEAVRRALLQVLSSLESDCSRKGYRKAWDYWTAWLAGKPPLDAGVSDMLAYLEAMKTAGRAATYRAWSLAILRVYYGEFVRAGLLAVNPAREVRAPRRDTAPKTPWLAGGEVRALLDAADAAIAAAPPERSWVLRRDRAMIWTAVFTGLRRRDVCRIRVEDFAHRPSDGLRLKVVVKGDKAGMIGIAPMLAARLSAWCEENNIGAGYIFRPAGHDDRPVSPGRFRAALSRAAALAGLAESQVTPHALRRSFVTLSRLGGATPEDRQAAVMHSSLKQTEAYDKADRQSNVNAANAVATEVFRK